MIDPAKTVSHMFQRGVLDALLVIGQLCVRLENAPVICVRRPTRVLWQESRSGLREPEWRSGSLLAEGISNQNGAPDIIYKCEKTEEMRLHHE